MASLNPLPPGYRLETGSASDRSQLLQWLKLTYTELFGSHSFDHLEVLVQQYWSSRTPVWWVKSEDETVVACLWLGNAVDQISGATFAHIFLLCVDPAHRRLGIGKALLQTAQNWAKTRGDRHIGIQVFTENKAAITLYQKFGFEIQSFSMLKSI